MKKSIITTILLMALISVFLIYTLNSSSTLESKGNYSLEESDNSNGGQRIAPFYEPSSIFPNIEAPEDFDWRQFEGVTLNFLVENNINANVLSKESQLFTEITGININIRPMDFSTLIQKINIDFISKTGKYQLLYVDPYQTLNRFAETNLEDLHRYNRDPSLPHIPGGIEDFFGEQIMVDSYFIDEEALYTVPFDTTTMILYYRKDIFEKYKEAFMEEKGYDWTPGQPDFTWERYVEVADWIEKNVPDDEVKYGSGHMAQRHNSIFCDFSNILASYGGDYFSDKNIRMLGLREPRHIRVLEPNFIEALNMYKKIIKTSAPESLGWDWYDTAEAFKNGEIAMMANWDENASAMENPATSKVAGKVGYGILPYGPKRSANIFGGSGIGINKHANEREKQAAWLFIVWATAPQTQLFVLKHPEGGGIPPRESVYQDEMIKKVVLDAIEKNDEKYRTMLQLPAVLQAWEEENVYYRPKIGNFYYVEQIIIKHLHEMIREDLSAEDTARSMYDEIKALGNK
ncbi:extracellular solute-binding protein [Clostridium formicaceticum]|uniref:ABC transporter-binding protein n=1 Tax=Clostridium formicaceticum TaxID=1497 RepID=A0AAC9RM77_9CLOT|nr:extracellular solute-binding protein [Clostridium formicaceticum]AOY77682.1 hypothetical protein BJL90_18550 [Clostridium formicaceticum]ARE88269.1 putative ABC transporter-binding protein precursor [Clostridium formicaceticum]